MNPTPKSYTGPSGGLKKASPWLSSEDIGTREVSVTIEDVEIYANIEFDKGRKEERIGALKFAGKEKRMVLNSTNRRTLVRMFGMDTAEWRGKSITIFVDQNVRFGKERVAGLRIKSEPTKAGNLLEEVGQ